MSVMTTAMEALAHGGGWDSGPWWPVFPLFWVLVWGALIFAFVRSRGGRWRRGPSAETVLAERYARGEIAVEEYRERLNVLKENQ